MRGIKCLYDVIDEVERLYQSSLVEKRYIWHHLEQPENFTPEEFDKLWDSFSDSKKIDYVLSLIQGA